MPRCAVPCAGVLIAAGIFSACRAESHAVSIEAGRAALLDASFADAVTPGGDVASSASASELGAFDYGRLVLDTNRFGLDVFRRSSDRRSNFVFSPLSLATALGVVYVGSAGDTADEMGRVLHDGIRREQYLRAVQRLCSELGAAPVAGPRGDDGTGPFGVLSERAIWLDPSAHPRPGYREAVERWFGATIASADQAPPGARANDRMLVSDTLAFRGKWQRPFPTGRTLPAVFHGWAGRDLVTPMMHDARLVPYARSRNAQTLRLAYADSNLSMTIVLPARGQFEAVRAHLDLEQLEGMEDQLEVHQVKIALPRFRLEPRPQDLAAAVEAAGIHLAFSTEADLSPISGDAPLRIGRLTQSVRFEATELGVEAKARTDVATLVVGIDDEAFVVDRPFLFLVSRADGPILLMGQIGDPAGF